MANLGWGLNVESEIRNDEIYTRPCAGIWDWREVER